MLAQRIAQGGALLAAALLVLGGCRKVAPCPGCNVVLISVDTLRADHVGAYGYAKPTTPNIDRLAERSVVFERAISQSSWTRPAHLSIMTGLYPVEHGVVALRDRQRLPDSIPTLAAVLAARGYRTAAFTGGVNLAPEFGFDRGFELYRTNGKYFRDNLEDFRHWLGEHAQERFFLFLHGYDPHTPYLTDPIDRIALGLPERPPRHGLRKACHARAARHRIARFVQEYDGAVHRADRFVGKILAELRGLGLLDHTVIVLTSDHGEEFYEHGGCFHLNTLYREVLHVPLMIFAPGLRPARVATLVPASVSIARTILELVGTGSDELPGFSLLAAARGQVKDQAVVSETFRSLRFDRGHGHLRSLTTESAKLIDWITLGRREMFDLVRDPGERRPLPPDPALARRLAAWVSEHAPKAGRAQRLSPQQAERIDEQLRALGYLN